MDKIKSVKIAAANGTMGNEIPLGADAEYIDMTYGDKNTTVFSILDNIRTGAYSVGSALKVNNHTVNSDVPSNAKFTDTTYSLASATNSGLISNNDYSYLNSLQKVLLSETDGLTIEGTTLNITGGGDKDLGFGIQVKPITSNPDNDPSNTVDINYKKSTYLQLGNEITSGTKIVSIPSSVRLKCQTGPIINGTLLMYKDSDNTLPSLYLSDGTGGAQYTMGINSNKEFYLYNNIKGVYIFRYSATDSHFYILGKQIV